MLLSRIQVDDESPVVIPGILVVHPFFHINVHAADGVNDALKCLRVDENIVIDGHAEELLHRFPRQLVSAVGIGMVDLVVGMSLDLHPCIAWDRHQGGLLLLHAHGCHHEGVTASRVIRTAVHPQDHHPCDGFLGIFHFHFMGALSPKVAPQNRHQQDHQDCPYDLYPLKAALDANFLHSHNLPLR